MADRRRDREVALTAAAEVLRTGGTEALVAAAQLLEPSRNLLIQYRTWQDESWAFLDAIGEYNSGIHWLSNSLSRVRLLAAELVPGGDEPAPIEDGPAAEAIEELAGGLPGQAAMLADFGIHLPLVGECYLTGEEDGGEQSWVVRSADEIEPLGAGRREGGRRLRRRRGAAPDPEWRVKVDDTIWRDLPPNAVVCRIWEKDRRYPWLASAVGKAAVPILREIDLYNRRIVAMLISRLAMNGILTIPEQVTFPTRPEFADEADPLVAELVDIASRAIAEPGTALAALPLPLRVPMEYIEGIKHITFYDQATEARHSLLDDREKAVTRLARTLRMPLDALLGTGDSNHWNAWLEDEHSLKIYISPPMETVCAGLATGYLYPWLRAAQQPLRTEAGNRIVVWYDLTELTAQPDRSAQSLELRDRFAISDRSMRKESGFDESAKPTRTELKTMALVKLLDNPNLAGEAYEKLTGDKFETPPPGATPPNGPGEGDPSGNGATAAPGGGNTRPDRPAEAPSNGARPVVVVTAPPR